MYDPLGAPSATDGRYDYDKKPFRGGPLGESKKILRLYARDRRREKMWRILLAIKFSYILIPIFIGLFGTIFVLQAEIDRAPFGTGPMSWWKLNPAEYEWNNKVESFVTFKTKKLDVECPPADLSGIDAQMWASYNRRNHRQPFDQAGQGCTIR